MTAKDAKSTTYFAKREQEECMVSHAQVTFPSIPSLMLAMLWYCHKGWTLIRQHPCFAQELQVSTGFYHARPDAKNVAAYHAVKGCHLLEGQWIAIIGCGGLGHLGASPII
jgi:hypothetical protein